jgi:GNAT superfamily N-acetyltransferase
MDASASGQHVTRPSLRQRLAGWASETTSRALVAERHEQVLAIVAVSAIPYLEHEGRWGRIVALVVSSACRGQGIGRQLVRAAENAASELGCVVIEVTSARSRTESHPFYQNLGYRHWADRSARYLKDLVPGASMTSYGSRFPAPPQSPGG